MMHSQLSGDSTAQITGGEQNKIKTYILLLRLRILLVLQEQLLDSGIYQAVEFLKAQSCCPDRRWIEKYADALMSAAVVNGSGCPANEERNRTIQSGVDCPKLIALTKLANDHSNMIVVFSSGKLLRPIREYLSKNGHDFSIAGAQLSYSLADHCNLCFLNPEGFKHSSFEMVEGNTRMLAHENGLIALVREHEHGNSCCCSDAPSRRRM
eukprot:GHVQ01025107.1.p2 GENE.GHVQ01025107.1~~GHVQ01025107.1.p2  ORF type:complete len:210 (-),score=20.63 GHVQ01025107.1:2321-2950(-)